MPCSNPSYDGTGVRTDNAPFETFTRSIVTTVPARFEVDSLPTLVSILQQAQREGRRVKAMGSAWSIAGVAISEWVVDLQRLNRRLTYLIDESTVSPAVTAARTTEHRSAGGDKLVHVEAGMKVFDLNVLLGGLGLSMITLGGAQGQRLAGAISTSTHGSDVEHPPLPDLVQAVHLVLHSGQELWIESRSNPLTDNDDELRRTLPCPDVRIIRDDDLLNAVRVGVGRFGVIYALVVKVSPAYRLAQWTQTLPWTTVSVALAAGLGRPGRGLFASLDPLLAAPPAGLQIATAPSQYRYLDVTFNPRRGTTCWVRRNWITNAAVDLNTEEGNNPLCDPGVGNLVLRLASAALTLYSVTVLGIPVYGLIKSPMIAHRAGELAAMSLHPVTGGQALAAAVNAVWESQIGDELVGLVDDLNQAVLDQTFGASMAQGKVGPNWHITSGQRESAFDRNCFNGSSLEIIFDTSDRRFIDFIDFILGAGRSYLQVGYVSVRFSRRSDALLSMHHVTSDVAVSIEVTSLQGLRDADLWLNTVYFHAMAMGGRPHWGQLNFLTEPEVRGLYGETIGRWRTKLGEVNGDDPTFSNDFTRRAGLEPAAIQRVVRGARRANGVITHLCNDAQYWSPVSIETVIADITRGIPYFYESQPSGALVGLRVHRILTTAPDHRTDNNLRSLPHGNYPGLGLPPPRTELRVTAVELDGDGGGNPWSSWILNLCNPEQGWKVNHLIAFEQVRAGTVSYYIETADGQRTPLLAREYVSTQPNDSLEDNLDHLPEC